MRPAKLCAVRHIRTSRGEHPSNGSPAIWPAFSGRQEPGRLRHAHIDGFVLAWGKCLHRDLPW